MQTFIVDYSLEENAKALDNKRLFKQLLEGYQILNSIVGDGTGWQNHPARLMWANNPISLFRYIKSIWVECQSRGIAKDSLLFQKSQDLISDYQIHHEGKIEVFPNWWGKLNIINSHKSRLICKGLIDAYCAAIKKHLKIKSMDKWLKERYGKTKNQLKFNDTFVLSDFIIENEIDNVPVNYYRQFNWEENNVDVHPKNDYVWPVSKE